MKAAFLKCAVERHGIVGDVPRILGCIAEAAHNPFFADEHPDLLRIHRSLLPALREGGVSEEQVARMMVDNPRRFLAGS